MTSSNIFSLTIFLIAIAVFVVLVISIVLVIVLIKNKKPKINVNNEFIDELVLNYGGIDNILSVEIENARLKITVSDLDLVNLEKLKALAESGIFVTGNTVKSLYKLNSEQIKKSLESRLNK